MLNEYSTSQWIELIQYAIFMLALCPTIYVLSYKLSYIGLVNKEKPKNRVKKGS
jgi:hypothetical protein